MGIGDDLQEGLTNVSSIIGENPLTSVLVASGTGAVIGAGTTAAIIGTIKKKRKKAKKKTKKSKKKTTKRKSKRRKLKFGSKAYRKKYLGKKRKKQKQPYTAGKRKDTSTRRIRYTKNNQPYVILANGRARFIKRSSASRSRKLKGGRY